MASRRQKQFDRKYSSFRKFTATEDVNYGTHSSRSSYRSESLTSRRDSHGRSTSSEIVAGTDTRSYPVYIAIQDYHPDTGDAEGIPLEQGQIVEVLDKKNPASWLVRTKARPPQSGWVPGSYFETPTEYYKQRRRTREIDLNTVNMTEEQEAVLKRDQVYHDLLRSEEEFVSDLRSCVDNYIRVLDDPGVPEKIHASKEKLALNMIELYNFHANVMLKGLNYYSDDPGKVGQTFIRLERDFDNHVQFFKDLPETFELLEKQPFKDFFQCLADKCSAGSRTFPAYLRSVTERITQYQNYFKEFVKYSKRANQNTKSMQKALELTLSVPQRVYDLEYTNNILQYPGDTNKLGRLIRHDTFQVFEGNEEEKERYVFLFRNKIMITDKNATTMPVSYNHYATIRLDKYSVLTQTTDEDTIVLKPNEPGLPSFRMKASDLCASEYIRKAWIRDIAEEHEIYTAEREHETETTTEFDVNLSDMRSEFTEYSGSRKSSLFTGPEEGGPPRKKVKSPPVISPTGSSTSIYSGGSSSIDWTTTGTTLEMQGTRVTRTQYGFRTLQESSAKMCLKVTGYPLPEITWYKDDVQLHEDERHTFYADEDGFFAMTIDPVQVEDTGRYTCMATNEYGQASTSAFFRVLKVEKEAASPAFINSLKDQECKEGEVVSFECEVEGWPEPELVWLVDDQPLRPSHDFKLEYDGQTAKLEIRDAQPDDTGVYTVKIQNEFGTAESKAELMVQPDPDKNHVAPDFQATIEDVECNEGDEVRFKAVITGDPNPEITWMINGLPLSESEKIRFISEDGICILIIQDVTRHFDGTVTCQGINRLGSTACDGRLKVNVPPQPPSFNKPLEDKVVQEQNQVSFEVDISGFPDPVTVFLLKGNELKNGVNGVEISGSDGYYKIVINDCSINEHDGELICRAVNEHGSAESRARLTVEQQEEESRSAPTFIKDIEDQTVKSGEPAVFETTVRGNPIPSVTWFINGQKMDSNSSGVKIEVVNHDHKITIDSAQYAGTVLCRAENSVGRFETKARLIVLPQESPKKAPRFIELLSDKCETEENTVVFEARVEAEPEPLIKWYLKGKELKSSDKIVVREFDGSIKLELKNISLEDAGEIKCIAENTEGSAESSANLSVTRKSFAPTFDQQPKSITVEKETEAKFEAHAEGNPQPNYQWSIDGRKIRENTEGATVSSVNGISVLTIDTLVHDSCTISVVAENILGVDETGARLTVEEKKIPKIIKELNDTVVNKGDFGHFETVIEHATDIKWFHNGTELMTNNQDVKMSQDDRFEFRLSINSSVFPSGIISAKCSNKAGFVETRCNMKVFEELKETKQPEFTDGLQDMEITQGEPFHMDVIALHSPHFQWTLNGIHMEDGKHGVHIVEEGNKSSLFVDEAKPIHSGRVTAEASNEIGTSQSSANVLITPKASIPVIIEGPKSVTVKEKESAEFMATITGYPDPLVSWTINDKVAEESKTMHITKIETEYSLKILESETAQGGLIKVTAQNKAGSDSKTAELKVEPSFTIPQFKSKLSDYVVKEGEPLRFDIVLDTPYFGTKIQWYLNGEELVSSDKIQVADHGDGTYHLVIAEAEIRMNGTMTVRASNPAGSCESSGNVTVQRCDKKPEFSKTPQNHETLIDESVKFSAVITGSPTPKVSWFLNEKKLEHSEEIKVKYEEETGKTSIRIYKPQIDHSGNVRVVAENSAGSVEATATLKVDKKTEVPKFTTNMDDRQVNEGDIVKYTATVEAYPEPTVEWTLNGEPVNKHPNIEVTDDKNGRHTIEIVNITPEQAGELSCQASNVVGLKKQNVQLAVKMVGEAPTFIKNLEDRLVTESEVTIMQAKLNQVKPKSKITWLRDGKEFKSDDHFKLEESENGDLQLTIASTNMEDKARITIRAENYFGSAECSASLGVVKKRPMAKPAFQSDIAPINLTEGDSLQTKLLITGDPTPFVKWYINGQLVVETEDTEIKNADGVYSLTIHGVSADMTGKIKCVAYNKMGEVSTEGPLKVVAPIPVEFETSLCDATCREGDTLKLKAVLLGEPTPVVSWYVNGKKLEESQNIKIHAEKGTYTVTIKDITCDYSGKVVCEAVNEYGTASSEAMLLVLPRGEPPDFLEWLSNVRARQGSKVVHKVVFTGDPKPVLTWYINNKEIISGEDISIVTDDKTSILTINNFNPDVHVGEIICKAENDAGEVSCTANMATYTSEMFSESESEAQAEEVIGDDMTVTDEESLREELHRTPTPIMAPKFITKIKDTKTKKGHEAIFECVVPDTKGVCCKWLKDGKEIELIARIRVQTRTIEGHTTEELIIENVTPEDAGKYTVIVENRAGKDICEATLVVVESLDKIPDSAPEFVIKLQDKSIKALDKLMFECKVMGEPEPKISWYHESKLLEEEYKKVIIENVEGIQRLVIDSVDIRHEGNYCCIAENSAGTSKTEAKLTVEAQAPTFTKPLGDQSLFIGEQLILTCSVQGSPQPHVEFFLDSIKLISSNRVSVEHDATNIHWRVVINDIRKDEMVTYSAVASNSAGSATSKAKVSMKDISPAFERGLIPISVRENEEIHMNVKIAGTRPEVSWFKDDIRIQEDINHEIFSDIPNGVYALIIKQASLQDAGKYSVKAVNKVGSANSSGDVLIIKATEKPTFIRELIPTEVKVGESASMTIAVKGVPEPVIEWLKDGKPIDIDGNLIIKEKSDITHSIVITSAKIEDAGVYNCQATNIAGVANTSANLVVTKHSEPPVFIEKLQSTEVTEAETLHLSVTVTGIPEPKIQWCKDEVPIEIDNMHIFTKDEGNGKFTLTIKDTKVSDIGNYSCKATNESGEAKTEAKMGVIESLIPPHFVEPLKPLEVEIGNLVKLSCTVEGKPQPEVTWFRNGDEVYMDSTHIIKKDEIGNHTLIIENVKNTDLGSYTCQAINSAGKDETRTELKTPRYGFEKAKSEEVEPLFIEPLHEILANDGDTVILECRVNKEAKPEIKWFKNNRALIIDSHVITESLDDGTIKLIINNVKAEDVGTYRCEASNKVGKVKTEAPLNVQYAVCVEETVKDESEQLKDSVDKFKELVTPKVEVVREPPEFIELLKSCTVHTNEQSVLRCKVKGEPKPKILWTKDGKEVEMSARVKSEFKDDGTLILTIENTTHGDAGEYRCAAENEMGTAWTESPIIIAAESLQQFDGEAPDFLEPVKPAVVEEGETAELVGKVTGKPRPTVKWYKNGEQLKKSDKFNIEDFEDGTQKLTVKNAQMEDMDEYRCEASNEHGDVWSDVTLTVRQKPPSTVAPNFVKTLVEVRVEKGEEVKFECKVMGQPEPEIKWYKDDKQISLEDTHFVQSKEADGTARLVITSAELKDSGEFRCEARNPVGIARTDAPLTVSEPEKVLLEYAPEFLDELQACQVNEGESAKFECRVSGMPLPTVRWFKNGEELKPGTGISIESTPDGFNKLTIDKTKTEDQGNYRAEAVNNAGSMSSKAPLSVHAIETLKIKKGLEDVTVPKGTKIQLSVEVVGQPKTIKWYKGTEQLSSNRNTSIEKVSDAEYKLEINNTEVRDSGSYRVVLSTDTESVESSSTVVVTDQYPKIHLPSFKKGLNDLEAPKGEPLVLEVEVEGIPSEIKWFKDGSELVGAKTEDLGSGKYRLVIPDFKDSDAGEYSITASNDAGEVESKAKITVKPSEVKKDTIKIEIVSGLTPKNVKQNETATFTVVAKGPVENVKWYKNNEEIPGAKTKDNGEGIYELIIPNVQADDAADYKVVLSNDVGEATSAAALSVKLRGIEVLKGLQDVSVPEGQEAIFEIQTNKLPKMVKWYKNGKEISPTNKVRPEEICDNKYQLIISDAKQDDVANYKVLLTDDDGNTVESSAALLVKLPKIEIVRGLQDIIVPKGQRALLEIQTSRPAKEVKWYKNGKEISPGDKAVYKKLDDNNYLLEVPDINENDVAEYKVVLKDNEDNSADSSCALTIKLPAEQPKITKGLEDQTVPIGAPVVLDIETLGSPTTVKWYKNGQLLPGDAASKIRINKINDNNFVLEIPASVLDDTGDYSVEVENDAGVDRTTGKVIVEPKLIFLKPLKDQEIFEGEDAEFGVEINAKPRTVKWYKNGLEINSDSHFVISDDGTKQNLVVKTATRDDAATFKVILTNSAGNVESSAKLIVKKTKPGVPKIIKELEDQIVAKGEALIFEIKVDGEPTEIRWLKDATPIVPGPNAVMEKIDGQTYRLTIPKSELKDAGYYTVEAMNETGKAKSNAKADVDEKPEIVKGLDDIELLLNDDHVYKVEVSTPVRSVKWYKNGQEITPSSNLIPKKIGPKKYELMINKAQMDDEATYKVILANAAGECDSSAAFKIVKPNVLKMLEGLKDIDVEEGQPIELMVKVEGIPKVVKWYKNGQEIVPNEDLKLNDNTAAGEFSLIIPSAKKNDSAAYRIVLTNDAGEIYSGAVVHVKMGKSTEPVKCANFLSPLQDTEVEEGDILILRCIIEGVPFPTITWEKDGVELKKDDRCAMRVALDGTVTLRLRDTQKTDFGQYRVIATNDGGMVTSACQVTVKDKGEVPSKPQFIIPLRQCETALGNTQEFNVKLRGHPMPSLEWFINGKPLVADERITFEDVGAGNHRLIISDVRESDFGIIRCIASNEHGKDECQAEFNKTITRPVREKEDDRYPPRFNVPLWDRRIPINDPLSIECHVDAKPTAEIEWLKDGEKLENSERIEIRNTLDGACRVRIARFGQDDIGVYTCIAKNELGVADTRSTYSVEVLEKEEMITENILAPRFNPGLEDKTFDCGETIKLTCTVEAVPKASIVWYKDGLPLRSDSRISIDYAEDGACSLTINDAADGDNGAYRCVATNEHGTINTSCLVTVKVPKSEVKREGEEPFFTKGLVDCWTDRGETFTLNCSITGDPFPEIKWYRNGILVRNSPHTQIETLADGTCTLKVSECTMSDEGIYRCEAENKYGKAKTQATAHIQISLAKNDKLKLEEGQPPRFIVPLEDETIYVGDIIDLECKVIGQPMPQVKWSKDGGPIWDDLRYEWDIDEAKGSYHLRIRSATVNDEGTYRCVATNDSGSATTKAFIKIDDGLFSAQPAAQNIPPRFTIKLGDARATEGQPLKLECKVEGSPLPEITWHKDGTQIQPSDRVQIIVEPDGTTKLLIPQCNMDDEGIYRVIAVNPSGSAHDKGNAIIKKLPKDAEKTSAEKELYDSNKAPKLIEPLENIKIPEKQGFRLRCKFSGDPKPTIKWFKDGERVFPYGRLDLAESLDGVCELIVDSSVRQDGGGYRCIAENTYGSARTNCEVNVIQERKPMRDLDAALKEGKAPGFTVPLTIKRAKPGETVTMECVPYGSPFPDIKWLKDGIELTPGPNTIIETGPDNTQRIILSNVDFFSEGYYRCVATNEYGTASTKAELCIDGDRRLSTKLVPEEIKEPTECKPKIRRGLHNMSIHQGNVVEMIVCATGWPTPTVKWYKDNNEVISEGSDGRRVIFTDDRGIHHLVILNAGPEDEGEYALEATNKLGSARTEGSLNIIRPRLVEGYGPDDRGGMPFPPGFVRQLKNKHVFNHMPTIFDCLVVGQPAPEVEWFHNGKKIIPGGRIKIQSSGGGSHAIIILDTTVDDAGEYVAVAKNSHGTASSSAILDVTVPHLDTIKFNGEIDVTPYLTEEYGFKKLNYASLPTPPDRGPFIKEVTGHYLTLSWIPSKRAPPRYPQVTYVIEIRELPEKEWTMLDYNVPEPVCKVRNLELGKSYQFRVRAENIYGISDPSPASPPSRLMAPPQPVLDRRTKKIIPLLDPYAERALDLAHAEQYACAPWFAPGVIDKRYCAENDTLTIVLNISGYPDPDIKWKFRGWDIDTRSPTSKCKVYTYGGTESMLTITGFSKDNVGQYQCVATNSYGEAQQNIMVDLATRPNFIQPLENRTFSSAQRMRLDVRVEGQPFPELKWMKEWRPVVESTRVKFVHEGPYLCSLIISDPLWRDSGIYTCVAINDAGQATSSCTVTVEADGDYNDVEIPKKKVIIEARKVREIYDIEEEDEKLAASGAPFRVRERCSGKQFLAQLKPIDDALKRNVDIHNSMDHENIEQFHQVLQDKQLALIVYENANGTLLDALVHPGVTVAEPTGGDRERMVQAFVRQLLLALQHMHEKRIAHLDLRPETILLQDSKLKLANFGQAKRLLRGMVTGTIQGSPEFVSPEIVRGYPLTLATDLWSVGTLTYVLLTGISPFHGDNDNETLNNVDKCKYSVTGEEWAPFSTDAADFVKNLLKEVPAHRMTCEEALQHPWLISPELKDSQLSADGLREFKYKHKWLERRVFVQQTPSEQLLEAILIPSVTTAQPQKAQSGTVNSSRPVEIYDYLRIKERPAVSAEEVVRNRKERPPIINEKGRPTDPRVRLEGSDWRNHGKGETKLPVDQNGRQIDLRKVPLDHQFGRLFLPEDLARIPYDSFGRPIDFSDQRFSLDQFGKPMIKQEELIQPQQFGPVQIDQFGRVIRGQNRPQDRTHPPPDYNMLEKKKLVPQEKGETPSKKEERISKDVISDEELLAQIPLRMIRGERRDIEEEIANRILSDISEEGSVAGSLASLDDFEVANSIKQRRDTHQKGTHSRSTTPHAESDASTPTLSPVNTIKEGRHFFSESAIEGLPLRDKEILEQAERDPAIPVGAPLFLEGLQSNTLTIDTKERSPSPGPRSPHKAKPGTKSPVLLSPGKEHSIEVVIATKRGKPDFLPPGEDAHELDDEDAKMDERKKKVRPSTHKEDFKDLRDNLEKSDSRKNVNVSDLDKYRPKNFYKEDMQFDRSGYDIDDSPWDSHYQIGPDTYLMATRGPSFNSRVRDYRRQLWGDGAPLVQEGILGYRNQDVTVRERRRYTDIIREQQIGIKPKLNEHSTSFHSLSINAIDRIKADIEKVAPSATKRNADGTFAPIFKSRMHDAYLKNSPAVFECEVFGSPAPKILWTFQGKQIESDGQYTVEQTSSTCRLVLNHPSPFDLGEYTCTATNEFGMDRATSRLVSGEAPSRPGRPECELSSDTEVFITWDAPEGPTYFEGIIYRLEYRMAGPNDHLATWIIVSENVDDETAVLRHLEPLGIYQFRVTAKNGFGLGLPSLTSRIIQTRSRGASKLHLDSLKSEYRMNILAVPQGTANHQLQGISEENEDEATMVVDLTLQDEDPFKRFQIDSRIFNGRFSVIRQAVDSRTESRSHCVAKIKYIGENSNDVLEEFETMKEAQHENVLHLIAAYRRSGFLYLFGERLFEDVFSRFTFNDYYTEEQISMTIRQLASALHWIHFKGIAHLAVNPQNVMFQSKRNWVVKLIGFGNAQFLDKAKKPIDFDMQWSPPEFYISEDKVTVQSDMWGLGIITFCLLSGFHPFTSEYDKSEELRENVLNVKCDPNLVPINASHESLSFVTWALKKSPLRRIRTDEALCHRFLSSDPSFIRKRESIKYPSSRLRKTALLTKQSQERPMSDELELKYGGEVIKD